MSTPDVVAVKADITKEFPSFKIAKKSDNRFMKLLAKLLGKQFMTSYVTTIGHTVYVPDTWDAWSAVAQCAVLRHERVHMRQARRLTMPVFTALYLLVFFPVGLAYWRARLEMEAYCESLAAFKEYGADYSSDDRKAWLVKQFTTSAYGYMWPFPRVIEGWFKKAMKKLDV